MKENLVQLGTSSGKDGTTAHRFWYECPIKGYLNEKKYGENSDSYASDEVIVGSLLHWCMDRLF